MIKLKTYKKIDGKTAAEIIAGAEVIEVGHGHYCAANKSLDLLLRININSKLRAYSASTGKASLMAMGIAEYKAMSVLLTEVADRYKAQGDDNVPG